MLASMLLHDGKYTSKLATAVVQHMTNIGSQLPLWKNNLLELHTMGIDCQATQRHSVPCNRVSRGMMQHNRMISAAVHLPQERYSNHPCNNRVVRHKVQVQH